MNRNTALWVSLTILLLAGAGYASGAEIPDVKIDQMEKRMRVTIPAGNLESPGREPNLLDRGAGVIGRGFYRTGQWTVETLGKGADYTVECIRGASRAVYGWVTGSSGEPHEK